MPPSGSPLALDRAGPTRPHQVAGLRVDAVDANVDGPVRARRDVASPDGLSSDVPVDAHDPRGRLGPFAEVLQPEGAPGAAAEKRNAEGQEDERRAGLAVARHAAKLPFPSGGRVGAR